MTPKKYPQNFHTQKNIYFSENPQKISKFKILNPKNGLSLRMYENIRVPPPPLGVIQPLLDTQQWFEAETSQSQNALSL